MKRIGIIISSFLAPVFAFAQSAGVNTSYLDSIFNAAQRILNTLLPLIIAAAVVWFIIVVFQYALSTDEEKKKAAKGHIVWGIIGLVVMVSVWGLVNIVANAVGVTPGQGAAQLPGLPQKP
jgi:flagellar biosynthesis protein FlhB